MLDKITAPDTTTGTFKVYGQDDSGLKTPTEPQGTVNVVPNRAPFPTGAPYTVSVLQNAPASPMTLKGSDLDFWDTTNLQVVLVGVGPGITVTQGGPLGTGTTIPCPIGMMTCNSPLTESADGTVGTKSDVFLNFQPNFNTAGGPTYIRYQLVDTFGVLSPVQQVDINVGFVNQAPTCTSSTITIPESYCTIAGFDCSSTAPGPPVGFLYLITLLLLPMMSMIRLLMLYLVLLQLSVLLLQVSRLPPDKEVVGCLS